MKNAERMLKLQRTQTSLEHAIHLAKEALPHAVGTMLEAHLELKRAIRELDKEPWIHAQVILLQHETSKELNQLEVVRYVRHLEKELEQRE